MKAKTKLLVAALTALLLVGAAVFVYFLYQGGSSADLVYVTPVADCSSVTSHYGANNRFIGVVEPQAVHEIPFDSSKIIDEVYVEVGDAVEVGDPLFSYDVDSLSLELADKKLAVQYTENDIQNNNDAIKQWEARKATAASESERAECSLQIQLLQNANRSLEYTLKAQRLEVQRLQDTINNAVVESTVTGTVQSVNDPENISYHGGSSAFITIMESGEFLIKGTVNEMHYYQLSAGMPVIIRSRVDPSLTWQGTVRSVDTSPAEDSNNNYYYYGVDSGMQSSKYYFYVELQLTEGLFLGQHVTIESGSGNGGSGLMLSEWFICGIEEGEPYVWKDEDGKLVRQSVALGEYYPELCEYEILAGLSANDYIAFPEESLAQGQRTTTEYFAPEPEIFPDEGAFSDEPFVDQPSVEGMPMPETELEGESELEAAE